MSSSGAQAQANNRFLDMSQQDLQAELENPLSAVRLTPEEVLFLALHREDAVVAKIAVADQDDDWVEALAAGFASLLQHCDMQDHPRIYHGSTPWHEAVKPPSVIATALLMFLGRLSVVNEAVYDACRRRGSIQGFLRLLEKQLEWLELGAERQTRRSQ